LADSQTEKIREFLFSELERLVEEYQELESVDGNPGFEQQYGDHIDMAPADYDLVVTIAHRMNCSAAVALAAALELRLLYPQYEIVFPPYRKN